MKVALPKKGADWKWAAEYGVTASVHHFSCQSITEGKYCAYVSTMQVLRIYRLVVRSLNQLAMADSGCGYLRKRARMRAMSMATLMQIG